MSGVPGAPKVPSGAQKEKKRKQKAAQIASLPKITKYFAAVEGPSQERKEEVEAEVDSSDTEPSLAADPMDFEDGLEPNVDALMPISDNEGANANPTIETRSDEESQPELPQDLVNISWPTDKCNFKGQGTSLSAETKRYILSQSLCQPKENFAKIDGHRFQSSLYHTLASRTGIAIHRAWLQYSIVTNEAYCLPCWLFGPTLPENNDLPSRSAWQTGFQAFKHTKQSAERHESSNIHINATQCMKVFKSNQGIDKALAEELKVEENYWRKVIERVIDVVIYLATQNHALRGHREEIAPLSDNSEKNKEDTNKGNFLATIELLAKYDSVTRDLLQTPKGKIKYLSKTIQNEVISCIAGLLKDQVRSEIEAAPYYSVIFDTTQDIAKVDQGSLILRYLDFQKDENGGTNDFKIYETFVGFVEVGDSSAASIYDLLVEEVSAFGPDFEKLRGMGFDGAANMKGQYNGVQAKIKAKQPAAMYVHCLAHNVNLVVRDVVKGLKELSDFIHYVKELYVFFAKSLPRWKTLDDKFRGKNPREDREEQEEESQMSASDSEQEGTTSGDGSCIDDEATLPQTGIIETDLCEDDSFTENEFPMPGRRQRVALKKLCSTRWEDHFKALETLTCSYADVIFCLEYFSTEDNDVDVRSRAQSLYTFFSKLDTVSILCLEFEKLRALNKCSKSLQNKSIELSEASGLLGTALEEIKKINLDSIISKAEEIAKIAGTKTSFSDKYADAGEKRPRKQPRHLANYVLSPSMQNSQRCGEMSAAERASKAKENFSKKVLAKDLEITIEEIHQRFESLKSLNEMFAFLSPKMLIQMTSAEISNCAKNFAKKYGEFEELALKTEILSCKAVYSSEISNLSSSQELLKFLLSESGMVGEAFKNLVSALVLFLTLPVTVASAERSFSKLKLIKTHLRSTMLQDRLSGLSLMSIERERTKNIDINDVVSRFIIEKKRRKF